MVEQIKQFTLSAEERDLYQAYKLLAHLRPMPLGRLAVDCPNGAPQCPGKLVVLSREVDGVGLSVVSA